MRSLRHVSLVVISVLLQSGCQNESQQAPPAKANADHVPPANKARPKEQSYKGQPVSDLIAKANSDGKETRWKAIEDLGKIDYHGADDQRTKVIVLLCTAFRDRDSTTQYVASESLKRFGKLALPAYLEALKDKNAEVRRHAASDLGGISEWQFAASRQPEFKVDEDLFPVPTELVIVALAEVLKTDKDEQVRQSAAMSLARLGGDGVGVLFATFKGDDPTARLLALSGIRRLQIEQKRKAMPILIERLGDDDGQLRMATISAITEMRNDAAEAAPALLKISKGHDQAAKDATNALSNITKVPRSTAPAFVAFLKDPEPMVRIKAIEYLCDLEENDAECLAALLELVKRRDTTVREKSARMIARYGSAAKPAVPALIEILRTDQSPSTTYAAIDALGRIGPDAKDSLPALKGLEKEYQKLLAERTEALKEVPAKQRGFDPMNYDGRVRAVRAAMAKIDQ